ncbi:hypothetical protein OH76DRAFT_1005773 [Lentinus brumalis]|uniref:Uncharacterized protein n=1 Tax=Lentinus brumalis TaxID=2498619 RepID=A0A371CYL7_9APHY|nr:hypothetical protein OH76DRAFT_1005773 [Polyporus brumalis]
MHPPSTSRLAGHATRESSPLHHPQPAGLHGHHQLQLLAAARRHAISISKFSSLRVTHRLAHFAIRDNYPSGIAWSIATWGSRRSRWGPTLTSRRMVRCKAGSSWLVSPASQERARKCPRVAIQSPISPRCGAARLLQLGLFAIVSTWIVLICLVHVHPHVAHVACAKSLGATRRRTTGESYVHALRGTPPRRITSRIINVNPRQTQLQSQLTSVAHRSHGPQPVLSCPSTWDILIRCPRNHLEMRLLHRSAICRILLMQYAVEHIIVLTHHRPLSLHLTQSTHVGSRIYCTKGLAYHVHHGTEHKLPCASVEIGK